MSMMPTIEDELKSLQQKSEYDNTTIQTYKAALENAESRYRFFLTNYQ